MLVPLPAGGAGTWTHSPTFLMASARPHCLQALPRVPPFLLVSSPASLLFQGQGSPLAPLYQILLCPVESLLTISSGIFFTKFSKKTLTSGFVSLGLLYFSVLKTFPPYEDLPTLQRPSRLESVLCLGLHCTLPSWRTLGSFSFLPWFSAKSSNAERGRRRPVRKCHWSERF